MRFFILILFTGVAYWGATEIMQAYNLAPEDYDHLLALFTGLLLGFAYGQGERNERKKHESHSTT